MMRIGPRELLFLVVLASVPVASWFFVFEPRNRDIAEARAEIDSMQATLAQLNEVNQEVGDLGEAVSASEIRLASFRRNIPDAEEVDEMLAELDAIGVRNSLNVKSIRTLKQVDIDGYSELPLNLDVEGEFLGIYRFLSDIENLPRITRVSDLQISRDLVGGLSAIGEEPRPGLVDMTLTLVIYFEDREVALAGAEGEHHE